MAYYHVKCVHIMAYYSLLASWFWSTKYYGFAYGQWGYRRDVENRESMVFSWCFWERKEKGTKNGKIIVPSNQVTIFLYVVFLGHNGHLNRMTVIETSV